MVVILETKSDPIFMYEIYCIFIKISLKFVPTYVEKSALVNGLATNTQQAIISTNDTLV